MDRITRARTMRRQPPSAERLLWGQLRDRRLCGFKFRRQRPVGPYVADFICPEQKLYVEVDGAPHDLSVAHDTVRDAKLRAAGYRVLRVPNDQVRGNLDGVCQTILNALAATVPPSP